MKIANKKKPSKTSAAVRSSLGARKTLIPTLVASGACGFLSMPAAALQLGEIEVQSNLGQPLRASIAFALAPNEQLSEYCVSLRPATAGMPGLGDARLFIAGGRINIQGTVPLREPIVDLGVRIACPYTANVTRNYTVMIDPAPLANSQARFAATTTQQNPQRERPADPRPAIDTPRPAARPEPLASEPLADLPPAAAEREAAPPASRSATPSTRRPADATVGRAIDTDSRYRVQSGDTLSNIVARIDDRSIGLWPAVERVFAANPEAFIDGDVNRLKAGSLLVIPSMGATVGREALAARPQPDAAPGRPQPAATTYEPVAATSATDSTGIAAVQDDARDAAESAPITAALPATTVVDETDDLRPGNATTAAEERLATPAPVATRSARPELTPAVVEPVVASESGFRYTSEVMAFGAGVLLTGALALVGWRVRRRKELPTEPLPTLVAVPQDNEVTAENRTLDLFTVADDVDRMPVLDGNLDSGEGFSHECDVEVAEDFAFSTTRDLGAALDIEFPSTADTAPNPVLGRRASDETILEKEILPTHDDDAESQYDVSMIVDVSEADFSIETDVTAKDLKAVAVDDEPTTPTRKLIAEIDERDYEILEQDYEDELTASQILQAEIAEAARAMGVMDDQPADDDTAATDERTALLREPSDDTQETGILDAATVEMQAAAEVEEQDDEERIEGDQTAEIPAARVESRKLGDTIAGTETTAKLPLAENDETAELSVESGHYKTGS